MRQGLIIAGFALLSVFGLVGWTRQPAVNATPAQFQQAATVPYQAPAVYPATSAYYVPNGAVPVYQQQPVYAQPPVYRQAARPAVMRSPVRSVVRRQRPLSHSVAIVAASAGAGAAIGALAGHGKGAAIGALAGGGAGFIYDRMTRNR
jgi:hypothetical protein